MTKLLRLFLDEYDTDGLRFGALKYRMGAGITCPFGLAQGYRVQEDGSLEWGWVRIHTGVDRAGGRNGDMVVCPFKFQRSQLIDYGNLGYGTLVLLDQEQYGFQMRIAHMKPGQDIRTGAMAKLRMGAGFHRNEIIGSAGSYGIGSGAHTHTEIVSLEGTSPLLDELLELKYGERALYEYRVEEIEAAYRAQERWRERALVEIMQDYKRLREERRAENLNGYRYRYWDGILRREATRYSSALLFAGL